MVDRITGLPAAELQKEALHAIHAVKLDFDSGAVTAHDGVGSFDYAGDTYLGVGEFGRLEIVTEDTAIRPQSVSLSLNGVDPALIDDVINDDYHLRSALLYLVVIDGDGQLIGDPALIWSGYMDFCQITIEESAALITMRCMDRLTDLSRARTVWLTDEYHRRRFPSDAGFEHAPEAARETRVTWGGTTSGTGSPPGGGDTGGGGYGGGGGGGGGEIP